MSDSLHPLEEIAEVGIWDGPTYRYRVAEIRCYLGGYVCGLIMPDHPLHGWTFGVADTITPLVDLWLDEGRLPEYYRTPNRWRP
jgi:hypothetical protein